MSIRELYEDDPVNTIVSDKDGKRRGVLLSRWEQWCWIAWGELNPPVTENAIDLWVWVPVKKLA